MINIFVEMKKLIRWCTSVICVFCLTTSCVKSSSGNDIVGTWQEVGNDSYPEILEIGKNGEWHEYLNGYDYSSNRWGEYTYDSTSRTIVVSIRAVSGNNGAYTDLYVIQHLSESRLSLIGDRYSESVRSYKRVR